MKIKTFAALALMLGLASPGRAQTQTEDTFVLAHTYDLDAAAYTYCATTGINGNNTGRNRQPPQGANRVSAAASTTLTCDGSLSCFNNVAVGDVLFINQIAGVVSGAAPVSGLPIIRSVTARASANSITMSGSAITLTAAPFEYRKLSCGTADTSGVIGVAGARSITFQVGLAQENSASTDYKIQCRLYGHAWSDVAGPTNDTSTFNDIFSTEVAYDECRVGAQVNTDDGGDTGANAEQLTILAKRVR